ncbi:MAG: ABC transporter permease [Lysinibacillus sp.]
MPNLFKERFLLEWQRNKKLFASIFDWTVTVYIAIPALIISFFLYKDYALHVESLWIADLHLAIILLALFVFTSKLTIRTYLQRADRLFLVQQQNIMRSLKQAGLYCSLTKQLLLFCVFLSFLLPLFIKVHHFTILDVMSLWALLFVVSFSSALLKYRIKKTWLHFTLQLCISLLSIYLFFYIPKIVLLVICASLYTFCLRSYNKHFIQQMKHFDEQVEQDQEVSYKWQRTVFQVAPELRSQLTPKMKKPRFLLKNSKHLVKRSDYFVEELVCKTMLRNSHYKWGFLRFYSVGIGLTPLLPLWGKLIVVTMLYFALRSYMQSVLQEITKHKVWTIFQVNQATIQVANKRLMKWFVQYPLLIVFIIIIFFQSIQLL